MTISHDDRVALVTGASRAEGLGAAVARNLASQGFHAVLAGRDLAQVQARAAELRADGLRATAVRLDLTDAASITGTAAYLTKEHGRLDALVHNATTMPETDADSLMAADIDSVREAFEVCVLGPWALTQACLPLLEAAPAARVVTVTSGATMQVHAGVHLPGGVGAPGYSMAKHAAEVFTTSLAAELRDRGILANSVDPGRFASHPELGYDPEDRPTAESARWVAWAATLPQDGPTGGLFEDGEPRG